MHLFAHRHGSFVGNGRPDVSDGVNPRLFDGEDAVFGFAGVQT